MSKNNTQFYQDSDPDVPCGWDGTLAIDLEVDGGAWIDINCDCPIYLTSEQLADLVGFIFRGHQSE